ncbi:hypothetical protein O181_047070 [Austropuccinia psidii MF-1]|uniref:Uncharacterized protein n=1 Tax=Austropuccinia psidii MF-1 TaxID=1389203 RepID=A0A9Q3HMU2_9BASI|nr:hypothetical protein [Austropuccinia psidii MF-1]
MFNWQCHHYYGQLAISFSHWPLWTIIHITNPQANSLVLGLRGPSRLPGAYGPTPLTMRILGHLDPLRPLQSVGRNPRPTVHMPLTLGPLGPFWPKSNEAKGGHVGPKPQVGPPEPNLAPNLISPKNVQKDPRTHIGHFQPLAFGNHQRPPDQAQQCFPFI